MFIARPDAAVTSTMQSSPFVSVMYVLGAFPVLSETFITNEIRAMRAQGHHVVPLALQRFDGNCQPEDEGFPGETVYLEKISARRALLAAAANPAGLRAALQFAKAQTGMRPRSLLLAGARVALAARKEGCTHLHAHFALPAAATAIVAAKLAGLTCSFTGHGYDIYGTPTDLALKLSHADVAIAVCEDMKADFLRLAPGANVSLVNCGVDPSRFRPRSESRGNGRLLAVGRLVEQKGYVVLLSALAMLPPGHRPVIDVVGAGELAEQIQHKAVELGVAGSIALLGPRSATWIAAEGPAYRGFVAPYVICANGDRDTGPLAVKEAMAMGLPVAVSALMGLKQLVTPACGRQVPPGDPAALADALRWLMDLPDDAARQIGAAARRRVEAMFTIGDQAAGLATAIRSVRR